MQPVVCNERVRWFQHHTCPFPQFLLDMMSSLVCRAESRSASGRRTKTGGDEAS